MDQRVNNARNLYLEAIRDGNYEQAINRYAGLRYTQHSTPVKDGKAGFIEFFAEFVKRNPIRDIEIIRSFEDGRYVFLQMLQTLNNGEFSYVTADIFDTDDDAKLIEHWDIIEELAETTLSGTPKSTDQPRSPTSTRPTTTRRLSPASWKTSSKPASTASQRIHLGRHLHPTQPVHRRRPRRTTSLPRRSRSERQQAVEAAAEFG